MLFGFIALNSILFGVCNVWVRLSFTGGFCGSISFQYVAVSFSNFALKPCADFALYLINWFLKCQAHLGLSISKEERGVWGLCDSWGFPCVLSLLCLSLELPQSGVSGTNSYFSCDSQEGRWSVCPGLYSVLTLHSVKALLAFLCLRFYHLAVSPGRHK